MGALPAWQAGVISAGHMSSSKTASRGQREELLWCAEGRHCCRSRVPLPHPLGLVGMFFLKPLFCCHFSCLTSPRYLLGAHPLLPAPALSAAQERAGSIPSGAAAGAEPGRDALGGETHSAGTSAPVDIKMLQTTGLISPETVSGKDGG